MARTAFEEAVASGVNIHSGAKFSDGTFPHNYWVSPNGNDGIGNGSQYAPFATWGRGVRQAINLRGDRLLITGGSYPETIDIGSGSTAGGNTNGGYAKGALQIIGDDSIHNGRTQLIGDGLTGQATLRVQAGYLGGFVLKNVELDTNDLTRPCLELVTSNTAAATATNTDLRFILDNVAVRAGANATTEPSVGFLFRGATLGIIKNCVVSGCLHGIGFAGSANNRCEDLEFYDCEFYDNTTTDIATLSNADGVGGVVTVGEVVGMRNVRFWRPRFYDRGATAVTNYADLTVATAVNCGFFEFIAARDVADNTLMVLPADWIAIGRSAAGAEFIIAT